MVYLEYGYVNLLCDICEESIFVLKCAWVGCMFVAVGGLSLVIRMSVERTMTHRSAATGHVFGSLLFVDTVQNVSQGLINLSHICSSHTMKVLGWHVTFVRRSSATVVALRIICIALNQWMALNSQICADVLLRSCSLTHSNNLFFAEFSVNTG